MFKEIEFSDIGQVVKFKFVVKITFPQVQIKPRETSSLLFSSHPISFHLISSHLISSPLLSSHLVSSRLVSSRLDLVLSCLIFSCLIFSCLLFVALLILSHLTSDHLIFTGHILSHIFSSYYTLPHVILNKPRRQEKNKLCSKLREEQVSDFRKNKR